MTQEQIAQTEAPTTPTADAPTTPAEGISFKDLTGESEAGLPFPGAHWHATEQLQVLSLVRSWSRRARTLTPRHELRRLNCTHDMLMEWDRTGDVGYLHGAIASARELWALRLLGETSKPSRRKTRRRRAQKGTTMAKKKAKKSKSKKSKKMSGY